MPCSAGFRDGGQGALAPAPFLISPHSGAQLILWGPVWNHFYGKVPMSKPAHRMKNPRFWVSAPPHEKSWSRHCHAHRYPMRIGHLYMGVPK